MGGYNFGEKGASALLIKDGRMTAKIYVDQVLRPPGLPFYKQCTEKWGDMIYMDDGAPYRTAKLTKKFCHEMGLFYA